MGYVTLAGWVYWTSDRWHMLDQSDFLSQDVGIVDILWWVLKLLSDSCGVS